MCTHLFEEGRVSAPQQRSVESRQRGRFESHAELRPYDGAPVERGLVVLRETAAVGHAAGLRDGRIRIYIRIWVRKISVAPDAASGAVACGSIPAGGDDAAIKLLRPVQGDAAPYLYLQSRSKTMSAHPADSARWSVD